jgi:hypothetical protein
MVCMDTDGEKSDHQYTFQASLKRWKKSSVSSGGF